MSPASSSSLMEIKVALDWTPNTIHTGLYAALAHNLYSAAGLYVQLLPPDASYSKTPAKLLESGDVDLAICPSESCIAYAESGRMHLQAIYAILQQDASAIVSTKVPMLKELGEGRVYGSYNARYEDHIVRYMVQHDGGEGRGMKITGEQGKLGLFEALKKGDVDATWVFMPWEGVEAEVEGTKLHVFKTGDSGVPYGYSPVIARDVGKGRLDGEVLRKFVEATQRGYELAVKDVDGAVETLHEYCTPRRSKEFLRKSQESINGFYGGEGALGTMKEEKWDVWVEWLRKQDLLKKSDIKAKDLFTNEFFPK